MFCVFAEIANYPPRSVEVGPERKDGGRARRHVDFADKLLTSMNENAQTLHGEIRFVFLVVDFFVFFVFISFLVRKKEISNFLKIEKKDRKIQENGENSSKIALKCKKREKKQQKYSKNLLK